MAIADDFSVDFTNGQIRYTGGGSTYYTVLELHRYLQALADDAQANGTTNDILDIASKNPSVRITDEIINLVDHTANSGVRYNIDDDAAEQLYGGSITQGSAETQDIYSGLRVLGSVVSTSTQLMVVQDEELYAYTTTPTAPFWGDQTTPYNGDTVTGVLMRVLIKSRQQGCDIDGQKVRVQARNYGDTYAFFDVTLGTGESVAAVSTVDDPQNDTAFGTVTAYTHVTNTEGYQTIDIGDGNGVQPYYSKWTYGADTSGDGLKGMWEFIKDLTKEGTAKTIHGLDGELFLGITHTYTYDNLSGTFTEDEEVVWGTRITYDALAGGTFTEGNYVRIGSSGAAGRVMYDNGTTIVTVALEDTSITLLDGDTITEYSVGSYNTPGTASGVTATINVTILNNAQSGGSGILLANDTGNTEHHIQLRTGSAPVDNLQVYGITSAATADIAVTVTAQTVNAVPMGSYVGSLIGGFGFGVDADDLGFPDTVVDLDGDTNSAPNNVTFTVNGPDNGAPDRLLVGPYDAVNVDFDWDQMTLNDVGLNTSGVTSVTVSSIPVNTPQTGWLRITLDDDRRFSVAYTSHSGSVFTIGSTDFTTPDNATTGNNVMVAYLDKDVASDPETYTTIYTSGQTIFVRLRDGGATPIQPFEGTAALGSGGGSITVSRLSDT